MTQQTAEAIEQLKPTLIAAGYEIRGNNIVMRADAQPKLVVTPEMEGQGREMDEMSETDS